MQPYYHSLFPASLSGEQLDHILALGWYRMHQQIFTTSHIQLGDIYRVHWLRYTIAELQMRPSHKRIYRLANNFRTRITDFAFTDEQRELHAVYRASVDFDGAPSITDCLFGSEVELPSIFNTKTVSVYDGEKLIACGYFDVGNKSAASILHYYDPAYARNSLGKYLMLCTLDYLRENNYVYYYPGYVVEGNTKMDYKFFLGKEQAQCFDPTSALWSYASKKPSSDF